jgi:hypothetical protein
LGYRRVQLGQAGLQYVIDYLKEGRGLAKLLLQRGDLARGHVSTILPDEISEKAALAFEYGLLPEPPPQTHIYYDDGGRRWTAVPKPNLEFLSVPTIAAFLRHAPKNACVLEDTNGRPSDPWVSNAETDLILTEDEVYHYLAASPAPAKERILAALRSARDWRFLGILTSTERPLLERREWFTLNEFAALAKNAQQILVGAYDGEGIIFWEQEAEQFKRVPVGLA